MSRYWQGARRQWRWWRQGCWRSEHIGVMWVRRGLQGRWEAVGGALVSCQWQGEGGGRCCCTRRGWVVGEMEGRTRRPVGLGAWGTTSAAAVEGERGAVLNQSEMKSQSCTLPNLCSDAHFSVQCLHTLSVLHLQTPPHISLALHGMLCECDLRKKNNNPKTHSHSSVRCILNATGKQHTEHLSSSIFS